MALRDRFTDELKTSMKAGTAARTSTLRMIMAKLKDIDIAARPKGVDKVPDDEVLAMLRGMVKSRRESVDLYRQGHRQDLVDKEEAEIAVIESFLPRQMDEAATQAAVAAAIAATGAAGIKDMGKVMAALRAQHAASLDMAKAGALVKVRLSQPASAATQPGDAQPGTPQSSGPESAAPQSGGPQSGEPQSGGPQSSGPQSSGPQSGGPQSAGPQSGGPQSGGPQSGGPSGSPGG
jgi:uncharacterized protein YqeY